MTESNEPKSQKTRNHILKSAISLFHEKGFDRTSMRDVAGRAEMSLGSTYYYFRTKEDLVFAYYLDSCATFQEKAREVFSETKDAAERIRSLMSARFEQLAKSRETLGALARAAVDPSSPLSPLSPETKEIREAAITVFSDALTGSNLRLPPKILKHAAKLLWLYHLGILFYWIHDKSPKQKKSALLLERTSGMLMKLLRISNLPVLRSILNPGIRLLEELDALEQKEHR